MSFVHLHNHTEYSLLDGASRIEELVDAAAEMQMPALAITDHGVLYGALPFYRAAKARGIKPIIGCEVYVAPRGRTMRDPKLDANPYHLVLLAANQQGYKNLMALSSLGFLEGFYYKPRVDKELLAQHSEGLIALSACLGGEIPELILKGDLEGARTAAREYREIFGRDNFYLELQDQGLAEQARVNAALLEIAKELELDVVATADTHYLRQSDASIHDVLLCIQTGKTIEDPDRMRFETDEFYLKSPEQMKALFPHVPEAISNTLKIAERCELELELGARHLPKFPLPKGVDAKGYLRHLATEGARSRYGEIRGEVEERLSHELRIIEQMGYCDYFLIVWDFVRFAREKGIMVGPGRGSAAGSMVSYCLGITQLDPLRWGLYFERFLNPDRVSMPDIDIDFCYERRGEVLDYVTKRYGEDHVAQIITFGTMAARAAVRDVGRAMALPYSLVDKVAKLIPPDAKTISEAVANESRLREMAEKEPQIQKLLAISAAIEGLPRHASTHAAGVVITDEKLLACTPLQRQGGGPVTTQYPMEVLESIGLLKMDFLGLRTLTVLQKASQLAGNVDLEKIPIDDPDVYRMLSRGETMGVFQLESQMFQQLLREVQPRCLEDVIATVALGRPGPMAMVPEYVKSKANPEQIAYLDPALEPILKDTYGIMVYQEQVMSIASVLAGFSLAEADSLRRAMSKKKPEDLLAMKERFVAGAVKRGLPSERAEKIFAQMEDFAGYGFNKSHAACYAYLAYLTAYLRLHYPAAFMAALLSSVQNQLEKVAFYVGGCRKMGLEVLPPDVNCSGVDFTVEEGKIRFGLSAVKNVGQAAVEEIVRARSGGSFTSLADFCSRVDLRIVNKRVLESLIKVGAFHSVHPNRRALLLNLDEAIRFGEAARQQRLSKQGALFTEEIAPPPMPGIEDFPTQELLAQEKEYLGLYLSGNPLQRWENLLAAYTTPISFLSELREGWVTVGGMVTGIKEITTKLGQRMAYVAIEDLGGSVELIVFPKVYDRCRPWLAEQRVVMASGKLEAAEEDTPARILADELLPIDEGVIQLQLTGRKEELVSLQKALREGKGTKPVILELTGAKTRWFISTDPSWWPQEQKLAGGRWKYQVIAPSG